MLLVLNLFYIVLRSKKTKRNFGCTGRASRNGRVLRFNTFLFIWEFNRGRATKRKHCWCFDNCSKLALSIYCILFYLHVYVAEPSLAFNQSVPVLKSWTSMILSVDTTSKSCPCSTYNFDCFTVICIIAALLSPNSLGMMVAYVAIVLMTFFIMWVHENSFGVCVHLVGR